MNEPAPEPAPATAAAPTPSAPSATPATPAPAGNATKPAAGPVNEYENLFGPDPSTKSNAKAKKKKGNPFDTGFGDESTDIKFDPEYRKMMDQILGKNPNSEYYKPIRP